VNVSRFSEPDPGLWRGLSGVVAAREVLEAPCDVALEDAHDLGGGLAFLGSSFDVALRAGSLDMRVITMR
jgi:hypothetical protein